MLTLLGCRVIARWHRVRGRRQRAGAVAHLHGGRITCARARHEARRDQDANRQGREEEQSYQQASRALLDPANVH
jgi:hypothetical protein